MTIDQAIAKLNQVQIMQVRQKEILELITELLKNIEETNIQIKAIREEVQEAFPS